MTNSRIGRLFAVVAIIATLASVLHSPAARGDEIPLFETAPPIELFAPPAVASADRPSLELFECGDAGQPSAEHAEHAAATVAKPTPDTRRRGYCYCPSWCTVCRTQKREVPTAGPWKTRVKYIDGETGKPTGDAAADARLLPQDVQDYAATHGYPVWRIETNSGAWIFVDKARSPDDLERLHALKVGDRIPETTFTEWVHKRHAAVASTGN